jgi:hypothetical protein
MNLLKISMALSKIMGYRIESKKLCDSLKIVKFSIHQALSDFMNNPG